MTLVHSVKSNYQIFEEHLINIFLFREAGIAQKLKSWYFFLFQVIT